MDKAGHTIPFLPPHLGGLPVEISDDEGSSEETTTVIHISDTECSDTEEDFSITDDDSEIDLDTDEHTSEETWEGSGDSVIDVAPPHTEEVDAEGEEASADWGMMSWCVLV